MKQKVLIAVLFGTIAYILGVVSGVLMGLSLEIILYKSISGFLIIAFSSFILIWIMENIHLVEKKRSGKKDTSDGQQVDDKEDGTLVSEKDFSPLDIPVVEAIESDGEGE